MLLVSTPPPYSEGSKIRTREPTAAELALACSKGHTVIDAPMLGCLPADPVEPAGIRAEAPAVIDRHLETTARIDDERRVRLRSQGSVRHRHGGAVLLEARARRQIRCHATNSRQVVKHTCA